MRRPIARILTPLLVATGCASQDYAQLYRTDSLAPSLEWGEVNELEYMGALLVDEGVNFTVYSERASRIEVLLFDDPEAELPTWQQELVPSPDGSPLFSLYVEGIGLGQHYGYIAWGPNWEFEETWRPGTTDGFRTDVDGDGNRFNPNKLLFDPWGRALHRDHDWSAGSVASGPMRHESTYAAGSKTVIVQSDYAWSEAEAEWQSARASNTLEGHDWADLVIYEVHPKGFTMNPASGAEHPGSYRGFGEMAPYLADLGITAVELMPIHEKPLDGGYWGYNNLSFFAPELSFSADFAATGDPSAVIDEFKWMVDALHQSGIEVLVDVVYNHTGEGGLWRERLYFETYEDAYEVNFDPKEVAGLYSYRGLDNAAWYALSEDSQTYWNNTGVGNQTRPNHTPMNRMVMDSLHFYVEEMHVDGFRFDLAGILGEPDLDYNSWIDPSETILQEILEDERLAHTRLIAEPWTASGTGPGIGGFPTSADGSQGWAEWNAHFRDWWRSFINNDDFALNSSEGIDGGGALTGSESVYGWNERAPYHAVNFITAHDGFTLYDLFSYTEKQNGCGLLNPVCCDDPLSVWCDDESGEENNRSHNWADEDIKRQMMRNMFTALFISHGTPMILGGDEWMRTQFGNNNAYSTSADNEWNWFRWGEWRSTYATHRSRMHDFVRGLTQLRREHAYALAPSEYGGGMPLAWKTPENEDMADEDWSGRSVAIHYYAADAYADEAELFILINMDRDPVEFSLPDGRDWGRVVDTQAWYDTPGPDESGGGWFDEEPTEDPYLSANITLDSPVSIDGDSYTAQGSSIVVLVQQ